MLCGGHSHSSRLSLCSISETLGSIASLVLALPAPEPGLPWDPSPAFMRWSLAHWKLTLMHLKITGKSFLHAPATCIHAPRTVPAFSSPPTLGPKQRPQLQSTSRYPPPALRPARGPVPPCTVSRHLSFLHICWQGLRSLQSPAFWRLLTATSPVWAQTDMAS